jgi:hypothetical protein
MRLVTPLVVPLVVDYSVSRRLVVDYSASAMRPGALSHRAAGNVTCRAASHRLLRLAQAHLQLLRLAQVRRRQLRLA